MMQFYKAKDRNNQPHDFRLLILVNESLLIVRHLAWFSEKDFNLDESISTDRYLIADFLRKGEYGIWRWQPIAEEEFLQYQAFWLRIYPPLVFPVSNP